MTLHRFGRIDTPSGASLTCDIDSITQKIIESINQQGISEAVKFYLDSQITKLVSENTKNIGVSIIEREHILSTLQNFSSNIDKAIGERTQTLESALGEVKTLTDSFSSQLLSINNDKVDKAYLDEKLKAVSDKIKNLEVLDRNYLNTKLKQLSTEIFTKVNETHPSGIDKQYLESTLQKLISSSITKEEFEKRLSEMAGAIKANIMDGIEQFITKDAIANLIKQIAEKYATKNDIEDFIKKNEMVDAVKSVRDEIAEAIKNSEEGAVMRLQCSAPFIEYLSLFIHKMAYDIVSKYAEVSFHMNWIEAKDHGLNEHQVVQIITEKMDLIKYKDFILAPKT